MSAADIGLTIAVGINAALLLTFTVAVLRDIIVDWLAQ